MTLAPLLTRALAGATDAADHPTDDRIIDAVLDELRVTRLRRLSLEDVARRAGVSRMTIYRRFGDRQRLIEATVVRETSRFLTAVALEDDPAAPAVERISTAFAAGLTAVRGHPVVAHWLAIDPGEVLNGVLADGRVLQAGGTFLADGIRQMSGSDADPDRLGELLARLFVALVLMPPPSFDLGDPEQARALARDLIAPMVVGTATSKESP